MEAKKERFRRIRGAILKFLAHQHPGTLDSKVILVLLDDLRLSITEEECQSHIVYLAEKGYVNMTVRKSTGVELSMITISPVGLDVLDGFVADVGVDVRF